MGTLGTVRIKEEEEEEEPWMRGQQMCPLYNTFLTVNSKLGRWHTQVPLAATLSPFMSLLYPPTP